jgi:hypothetical protein
MSAFSDLRASLAADLAGMAATVTASWPEEIDPPCAFITPPIGGDYVRRGPTFREHTIVVDLVLLVEHGNANNALDQLEGLVQYALVNTAADWALEGVEPPAPTTVVEGGAEYLASVIHLSKPVIM